MKTIAEIQGMKGGEVVDKAAFEVAFVANQDWDGDATTQIVNVKDRAGDTIEVVLVGLEEFQFDHKDQIIVEGGVASGRGKTKYLEVTDKCRIYAAGKEKAEKDLPPIPTEDEPDAEWEPEPYKEPAKKAKAATKEDAANFKEARLTIIQIANLHALCTLAVERMEIPFLEAVLDKEFSEERHQAAVASVFIKADRSGLMADMPKKPFDPEEYNQTNKKKK